MKEFVVLLIRPVYLASRVSYFESCLGSNSLTKVAGVNASGLVILPRPIDTVHPDGNMSSDTYKQIILTQLHTLLKPIGFRKKQQCFSAEQGDTVLFIQMQSSKKSTKNVLVVTINLGIFSRIVAESVRNTRAPNVYDAHWRARIGSLMPDESDKWWEVQSSDEAHLCGTEITSILTNRALPQMRGLASTDLLKSLWEKGKSPGLTDYQREQYLQALDRRQRSSTNSP